MEKVRQLTSLQTTSRPSPPRIMRPCDYGLARVLRDLETQVGTVEAYNKLCDAAAALKARIDAGRGQQAAAFWATDPKWIYPQRK